MPADGTDAAPNVAAFDSMLRLALILCGGPLPPDPALAPTALTLAGLADLCGGGGGGSVGAGGDPSGSGSGSEKDGLRLPLGTVTADASMREYDRLRGITAGGDAMPYQWLAAKLVQVYCNPKPHTGSKPLTRGAVFSGIRLFAKYVAVSALAQAELADSTRPMTALARQLVRFQREAGLFGVDFIAQQCVELCAALFDSTTIRKCAASHHHQQFLDRCRMHRNHLCAVLRFDVVELSPVDLLVPLEPAMHLCHRDLTADVVHVLDQVLVWPEFALPYNHATGIITFAAIYFSAARFFGAGGAVDAKGETAGGGVAAMPLGLAEVAAHCPAAALFTAQLMAAEEGSAATGASSERECPTNAAV